MPADAVIVVVFMLLVGCAAFLFGILYLLARLIGGVGRCMMRMVGLGRRQNPNGPVPPTSRIQVCPREHCGEKEYRTEARFCSQCGTPLTGVPAGEKR